MDCLLKGTKEQPDLHLRFSGLEKQSKREDAIVRYIAHPGNLRSVNETNCVSFLQGELIRATFDMKVFPYELCRVIFESNSPAAQFTKIYSISSGRVFQDFNLYFGR